MIVLTAGKACQCRWEALRPAATTPGRLLEVRHAPAGQLVQEARRDEGPMGRGIEIGDDRHDGSVKLNLGAQLIVRFNQSR